MRFQGQLFHLLRRKGKPDGQYGAVLPQNLEGLIEIAAAIAQPKTGAGKAEHWDQHHARGDLRRIGPRVLRVMGTGFQLVFWPPTAEDQRLITPDHHGQAYFNALARRPRQDLTAIDLMGHRPKGTQGLTAAFLFEIEGVEDQFLYRQGRRLPCGRVDRGPCLCRPLPERIFVFPDGYGFTSLWGAWRDRT